MSRPLATARRSSLPRRATTSTTKVCYGRPLSSLADHLVLLIDGAYVNGQLLSKKGPVHSLVAAGLAVILAAERR